MPRFALLIALCGLAVPASAQALVAGAADLELTAPAVEPAPAPEPARVVDYAAFSRQLRHALQSDNAGLRMDALRQVAFHGAHVDLGPAIFDVTRLFRDSKDVQVRLLALRALEASNDRWATNFIRRSTYFERDPRVRHALEAITAQMR